MNRGFSIIEILIVVALTFGIVIAIFDFASNTNSLNGLLNIGLQSKSTVNQALEVMVNEIRSAEPSQNGSFAIDSASTGSFAFYTNVDGDSAAEHVRYFLASSTIWKGVIQPTGTPAQYPTSTEVVTDVVDGVSTASGTPLFQYYGSSYTGTQSPLAVPVNISQVSLVGINFKVSVRASSSPTSTTGYSTMVDIRNLRGSD